MSNQQDNDVEGMPLVNLAAAPANVDPAMVGRIENYRNTAKLREEEEQLKAKLRRSKRRVACGSVIASIFITMAIFIIVNHFQDHTDGDMVRYPPLHYNRTQEVYIVEAGDFNKSVALTFTFPIDAYLIDVHDYYAIQNLTIEVNRDGKLVGKHAALYIVDESYPVYHFDAPINITLTDEVAEFCILSPSQIFVHLDVQLRIKVKVDEKVEKSSRDFRTSACCSDRETCWVSSSTDPIYI